MKKLVFTLSLFLMVLLGYSQVTNVGDFRIANTTTAFGVNLPIGTKVYDIANNKYYVATAGVVSTATLTTASASFTLLNDSGTDDQTATEVSVTASGNLASENVQDALEELQSDIDGNASDISTNTSNISTNAGNISTNTSNISTNTSAIAAFSDTDDQTAAEVSITDTDGDYSSTNVEDALAEIGDSIAAHRTDIDGNTSDISTNTSNISTNASGISTNTSNISTNTTAISGITSNVSTQLSTGTVNGTSYGITSDGGTDDVVLAAATNSAAGVMTAAQVTKLEGIDASADVNLTLWTEKFEEDNGTATAHSLEQTAVLIQGAIVTLNGVRLAPGKYTFTTSAITIGVPVYQYDQVIITYSVLNPVF